MLPTRKLRKPFTTRQIAPNHARSLSNSAESGATVCRRVSEYLMPYCLRLLQADIFPQKLSRRCRIVIFAASSGVACISTGTSSRAGGPGRALRRKLEEDHLVGSFQQLRQRVRKKLGP